jgi:hypothetical protein
MVLLRAKNPPELWIQETCLEGGGESVQQGEGEQEVGHSVHVEQEGGGRVVHLSCFCPVLQKRHI